MTDNTINQLGKSDGSETVEKDGVRAQKKAQRGATVSELTNLYRYFDETDDLIYVGISRSAVIRMFQHDAKSSWFGEVTTIKIDKFKTRKQAEREERRLIELCKPKYNIVYSKPVNRIRRKIIRTYGSLEAWNATFGKSG